jgi:DNA repair exonuclease SbcCD ATPase subunit
MIAYFGPHHTPADEYPMSCRLQDEANCQWVAALPAALAAAQQEAAHYMSVAQKATDELARLRAELAEAKEECKNVRLKWHTVMGRCAAKEDEIIELGEELASLRDELSKVYALVTPVGFDLPGGIFDASQAVSELRARAERAEKAEAECLEQARLLGMSGEREADLLGKLERLAKDKARLDWLESPAGFDWQWNSAHSVIVRRAAIDAAMKP